MVHWCADETAMLLSSIPFVGFYIRKFHLWYSGKFPKHKDNCHATGIDPIPAEPSLPVTVRDIPFRTTKSQLLLMHTYTMEMERLGYDPKFIDDVATLASTDQGMYDLLEMWYHADDTDRVFVFKDLEQGMKDYNSSSLHEDKRTFAPLDGYTMNKGTSCCGCACKNDECE